MDKHQTENPAGKAIHHFKVVGLLNESQCEMYICQASAVWMGVLQERFCPGLQDCPAPLSHLSLRSVSPARNRPTLSCTAALLPRHRFPVASSLAQPQTASSALKSGL